MELKKVLFFNHCSYDLKIDKTFFTETYCFTIKADSVQENKIIDFINKSNSSKKEFNDYLKTI